MKYLVFIGYDNLPGRYRCNCRMSFRGNSFSLSNGSKAVDILCCMMLVNVVFYAMKSIFCRIYQKLLIRKWNVFRDPKELLGQDWNFFYMQFNWLKNKHFILLQVAISKMKTFYFVLSVVWMSRTVDWLKNDCIILDAFTIKKSEIDCNIDLFLIETA